MAKELGPRINSSDIIPEIRELATAWGDHYSDPIWEKFKLASDVQYLAIDLLKQFCKWSDIDDVHVEMFIRHKAFTNPA